MKKALSLALLMVSMASAEVLAQAEPTPMATPADVPVPTAPLANPGPSPAATCPSAGGSACEMCEKHTDAATDSENEEAVLTKLEQDWADAVVRHDVDFLERLEADDYIYTGPDGVVAHKTDDLAGAKVAFAQIESFAHRGIKVSIYGNTAVVTGATTLKGTATNADLSGDFRWTDVFVKHGRRWQVVASQATPISKTAPED